MRRQSHVVGTALVSVTAVAAVVLSSGCPKDPFDPETWISDLDHPHKWEDAVRQLDQLGEPVAIEPLVEAWEDHNRPSRILRTVISLADQPDEDGGPFWDAAVPMLITALDESDISDSSSRNDAVAAARALGRAGDTEAVPALVNAATRTLPRLSPGQEVRRAAVFALGEFGENDQAFNTLVRVLEEDTDDQPIEVHGAAVMALGTTDREDAIQPLLAALFELPELYRQTRAALTGLGEPVIAELIRIFRGQHDEINELAKELGFAENCDRAMGPDTDCQAPGNLHFRSASVLGDMRANEAVPVLAEELGNDPEIAYFDDERGLRGPPSHQAILDALGKIGDPRAEGPLRRYWRDDDNQTGLRAFAMDKYSMVARSGESIGRLTSTMQEGNDELSNAAALAGARIISTEDRLAPYNQNIAEHRDEADELEAKAEELAEEAEELTEQLDEDDDGGEALRERAAERARQASQHRNRASNKRNSQRMYEQHKGRILVGIQCDGDASCYAELLTLEADELADELEELGLEGASDYDRGERSSLQVAARERALLDLAKMGDAASDALEAVLEIASTTNGTTRDAVLVALPQIAELPCDECRDRLDEIVESQRGQSRLSRITGNTRILKHYFTWAGRD